MTGGRSGAAVTPTIQADATVGALAERSRDAARIRAKTDEWQLVDALREGDEVAFVTLIEHHHAALVRLSRLYVPAREADDLAQAVWAALLATLAAPDELDRTVSPRVVLFRLLLDRARSRYPDDAEMPAFAARWSGRAELDEAPVLDPSYFRASGPWVGHWTAPVSSWEFEQDDQLLARELRGLSEAALTTLPPAQREVVALRDVEGWTPDEVSSALGINLTTQRALLHRGRSQIRSALDALSVRQ